MLRKLLTRRRLKIAVALCLLLAVVNDSVGNRLARSSNISAVPTAAHSYTANDWLTSDSYDSNGNTVNAGGIPDTYDFENRLVTHLYGQIVLVYDGDGNRVKQTVSGMSTYYVVDDRNPTGYAQVLEELTSVYSGATTLQRVYTHGHALISQDQLVNGQWVRSYYGQDGHGSVRYLTDGQGNVTDAYDYDAFGVLIRATGGTPNSYLYCGEQYDVSLGLYYLRARYANPKTGRFWNMDSFEGSSEDPHTLHKYLYCHANPVNGRDPSGHDFSAIGACVAGSIATSLHSVYDGGVSEVGFGLMDAIEGVEEGKLEEDILADYIMGSAGIGGLVFNTFAELVEPLVMEVMDEISDVLSVGPQSNISNGAASMISGNALGIIKKIRNPFGRRGGPAHVAKILAVEARLTLKGYKLVSGGSGHEAKVTLASGKIRYPDLVMVKNGKQIAVQVGRANKGGSPVAREVRAKVDLQGTKEYEKVIFIRYN